MRNETNLIGIHTLNVSTEMPSFAKTGVYRIVPMILYKINDTPVSHFCIDRPMEVFRENMNYGNIANNEKKGVSFLTIPGKAYSKMQQYANRNVNKVMADMITYIVTKITKELNEKNPDANNIFFINSTDTNKIIGRLGYLYLENRNNTIAFVTYNTGGLLTDILNEGNEKLQFDINYFKDEIHKNRTLSEIIPNDFMESMTQTVFFNIPNREEELVPLRCDILSQGISKNDIRNKVQKISEVLRCPDNITLPFSESEGSNMWMRIPRVLNECIEAEEIYKNVAQVILEGNVYV